MHPLSTLLLAAAALAIEASFGYPRVLFRVIGHPVTWAGALIGATETRFNNGRSKPGIRRALGVAALTFWLAIVGALAFTASSICAD